MYDDVLKKYYNDVEEYEKANEECKKALIEFDDIIDSICTEFKTSKELTSEENEILQNLSNDKLVDIRNEYNAKSLFKRYVFSYFYACISIRNEMILKDNSILFYSYMFNLTHFLELNIKALGFFNVEEFDKKEIGHWILEMYSKNKEKIINLGVEEKYYNILIELLTNLRNLVNNSDIAMCFKYPVCKDFSTSTITNDIKEISLSKIKEFVEEHKILIYIALDIYMLGETSNFKKIVELANQKVKELQDFEI